MNKQQIRKMMKDKLQGMSIPQYQQWSKDIATHLFHTVDWKAAHTIGITISRGREVDTIHIIENAWKQGKRVAVPKCVPESRDMVFRIIDSFEQLESVYYNLQEPKETVTTAILPTEIDFLMVPGLAYDKKGYRVGFGGGYYDRFLSKFENHTAALAFELQLVEEDLPIEDHDLAVKAIITNERVLRCN